MAGLLLALQGWLPARAMGASGAVAETGLFDWGGTVRAQTPANELSSRQRVDSTGPCASTGICSSVDTKAADVVTPSLTLAVSTARSITPVLDAIVNSGEFVTYVVRYVPGDPPPSQNLDIVDVLPSGKLDSISCLACVPRLTRSVVYTRINAIGDTEVVTTVSEIGWVAPRAVTRSQEFTFSARVVAAPGNDILNSVIAAGNDTGLVSPYVRLEVKPQLPATPVKRQDLLSGTPIWYSQDFGGTLDMDWADIDGDGDADVALASSAGVSVYAYDDGQLTLLWQDPRARYTYAVRWAHVLTDTDRPQLIAIGTPSTGDGSGATAVGFNYVYRYNQEAQQPQNRFEQVPVNGVFTSTEQLARVEVVHANEDGLDDLVVSVTALNSACPVYLIVAAPDTLYNHPADACINSAAAAALAAADFDGNGVTDYLALGQFPNQVELLASSSITEARFAPDSLAYRMTVDNRSYFQAYDLAWGDVNNDRLLDLVAAFPLQHEVRVYLNQGMAGGQYTFQQLSPLRTDVFQTPYAIDLADLDLDGYLDLLVADNQPVIFWNSGDRANPYQQAEGSGKTTITIPQQRPEIWGLRGIDVDGNGVREMAVASRRNSSILLASYVPLLAGLAVPIAGSGAAQGIAVGDVNDDGYLDLLLGSAPTRNSSRLFLNNGGYFNTNNVVIYPADSVGTHRVAVASVDRTGLQRPTLATPTGFRILTEGGQELFRLDNGAPAKAMAWGDIDGNGDLDLAMAGNPGPILVAINAPTGIFTATPAITVTAGPISYTALAWGDVDGDYYMDLVAAVDGAPNQLFLNQKNGTLAPPVDLPGDCEAGATRSIGLADANADGRLDLAMANADGQVCVALNTSGPAGSGGAETIFGEPVVLADEPGVQFVYLDWGDWDADGDPDLAVGSNGGHTRVYVNYDGDFAWQWESREAAPPATTSVRWGDVDNDGDLDLVTTRRDDDAGIYINNYVNATHLAAGQGAGTAPGGWSGQGLYTYVARPGITADAYGNSSSELLPYGSWPITVAYTIYDTGDLVHDSSSAAVDSPTRIFEYQAAGDGQWRTATPAAGSPVTETAGLPRDDGSIPYVFLWDAGADGAIGDQVRVRVTVVNPIGGPELQRTSASAVSPPFQVRSRDCVWPGRPSMWIDSTLIPQGSLATAARDKTLEFSASVGTGSGKLNFLWNFARQDQAGSFEKTAQRFAYNISQDSTYTVTLRITNLDCSPRREVVTSFRLIVGSGASINYPLYFPLVVRP